LRLLKSEKGIGTVVAAIMFLMISILFVGGTFLWQSTSKSHMIAYDKDRMDESLSVEASYSYDNVTKIYTTELKVRNTGPIDIQLIQAWIIDETNNDHQNVDVNYPIAVDTYEYVAEMDDLKNSLTNPFDLTTTTYFFKVVTERGNIASSRLMPQTAFQSNWPAVIIPGASWVKRENNSGHINLVVFNRLEEDLHIGLIVASRLYHGAEQSELIEADWIIPGGAQEERDFWGNEGQIYQVGEIVFIELADIDGIVVSSYYFVCQ